MSAEKEAEMTGDPRQETDGRVHQGLGSDPRDSHQVIASLAGSVDDVELAERMRQDETAAALTDLDRALSALEACIYRDPDHNAAWMEGGSVPVCATEEARDAYDRLVVALREEQSDERL